jgi:hypothetical protein
MKTKEERLFVEFPEDSSVIVNFDLINLEDGDLIGAGGYVHVRKEETDFSVTVFNVDGDVVGEIHVPFNFKGLEE